MERGEVGLERGSVSGDIRLERRSVSGVFNLEPDQGTFLKPGMASPHRRECILVPG